MKFITVILSLLAFLVQSVAGIENHDLKDTPSFKAAVNDRAKIQIEFENLVKVFDDAGIDAFDWWCTSSPDVYKEVREKGNKTPDLNGKTRNFRNFISKYQSYPGEVIWSNYFFCKPLMYWLNYDAETQ